MGWCWSCPHPGPDTRSKTNDRPYCSPGTDSKPHRSGMALGMEREDREGNRKILFHQNVRGLPARSSVSERVCVQPHTQTDAPEQKRPPRQASPVAQARGLAAPEAWHEHPPTPRGQHLGARHMRRKRLQLLTPQTERNPGMAANTQTRALWQGWATHFVPQSALVLPPHLPPRVLEEKLLGEEATRSGQTEKPRGKGTCHNRWAKGE